MGDPYEIYISQLNFRGREVADRYKSGQPTDVIREREEDSHFRKIK